MLAYIFVSLLRRVRTRLSHRLANRLAASLLTFTKARYLDADYFSFSFGFVGSFLVYPTWACCSALHRHSVELFERRESLRL